MFKFSLPHVSVKQIAITICALCIIIGSFVLGIATAADDGSAALKAELKTLQNEVTTNSNEWNETLPKYQAEAQHCVVAEGLNARMDELADRNDKSRTRIQAILKQLDF